MVSHEVNYTLIHFMAFFFLEKALLYNKNTIILHAI